MPLALNELVRFRGDKLFNGAVNIDWFTTDEERAGSASEAFIFHGPEYHGVSQGDVGTGHGHLLQDTATFALSLVRRGYGIDDQPFTLAIAGYGTGKSHLALTLATLLESPSGHVASKVLSAIDSADPAIGKELRAIFLESQKPCLVVALNGMKSVDLTAEITQQIIHQAKRRNLNTRSLDELRPRFAQAASLIGMANDVVLQALVAACELTVAEALAALEHQDERVYAAIHEFFAARGMAITALRGESVRDVIDVSVREYCGEGKPFRTLVVLFDEFGRYTEFATVRSQIAGSGVLQDLFEAIQANHDTTCFAGFIQFELNAYVQRVAPEYRNEILRYITRYQAANRVYLSINLETLIANLVEKRRPEVLNEWFDNPDALERSQQVARQLSSWFPQTRNHRLWSDPEQFHSVIRKGCWPLAASSTWFLFHLAAAGKHLQERSALAMLDQLFARFTDAVVPDNGSWVLAAVDLWSEGLQEELIGSEETGQQGAITHAYASVDARHGAILPENLKLLLRAIVLASKMGLQASDRDDATAAISELARLPLSEAGVGLRLLQTEYNVVEWDDAFRQFDILGDSVPRTQFLSFIRQRVASSYDESAKAALFASRAHTWCDLLGDLECDFSEENKISTREWCYSGVTSNLDTLPMQLKLAADRWQQSISVDDPRGTIIYCYAKVDQDPTSVGAEITKLTRAAARATGSSALPILTVLLCDEEGALGEALAELAVLEEGLSEEDKARFGNLIGAHSEKLRQVVRTQVDMMLKQRLYITSLKDGLTAQRLSKAGSELFASIYKAPLSFPFDGFSTARGNAAESCQELTSELFLGKLDYDAVIGKPMKVKNRAVTVLKDSWRVFAKDGSILTRPGHPVLRSVTTHWDEMLAADERRLPLESAIRDLCKPPYGANAASAALLLGVFIAARFDKLVIASKGQQHAISQWVQSGIFRGKFLDLNGLKELYLVTLGEESSEWEVLLDEWEQAESYSLRASCLGRSAELKRRIPIPPPLVYREIHLEQLSKAALDAMAEMERKQDEAFAKLESSYERGNVGALAWAGAILYDLAQRMVAESPLWDDHDISKIREHVERTRQEIIQSFPQWLPQQTPRTDSPDAVGDFKHKMIRLTGGNLKKLDLPALSAELEKHVTQIIRNVETAAESRQLVRDVRSWIASHADASRVVRVADGDALFRLGKDYTTKLQGMSQRIQSPELGEARAQLSEFLARLKEAIEQIRKRAGRLWNKKLQSESDLDECLEEVESLVTAFENCTNDLDDLHLMRRALRTYREDRRQLADERLTWAQFENLGEQLQREAESAIDDDDVPWRPNDVIRAFVSAISKRRVEASASWIARIEEDAAGVASMSAADANRLQARCNLPPPVLTEADSDRVEQILSNVEARLDSLKVDWLVEKFNELPVSSRRKFLQIVDGVKREDRVLGSEEVRVESETA